MAEKLITKQVLIDAIDEAFDEIEGLRLAGELEGNATHGLFTRELLNVLEAKGYDLDNPENIKRLDNWALNSGFSDTKSFADLIIADVKEPTLVQSAYPGNFFDDDLNIIKTAQPTNTIFSKNITKDVIKNEILNDRSSLDENTIEYIKKNTDTPTNAVDDDLKKASPIFGGREGLPITPEQDRMFEIKWADHWATEGDMWGVQVHGTYTAEVVDGFYQFKADNPDIPNWWFPRDFMDGQQLTQRAFVGWGVTQEDIDNLKEGFEKNIFDKEKDKKLLEVVNDLDGSDKLIKSIDTPTNVVDDLLETLYEKYDQYLDEDVFEEGALNFNIDVDDTGKEYISLQNIAIKDEYQNKGIGKEILNEIKKTSDELNIPIVATALDTEPTGFFAKQGFVLDKDLGEMVYTPTNVVEKSGGSLGAAKLNDPLVFDSWIDNYAKTTTSFVDNLPLSTTVKNQFNNLVQGRARNLATPGGVADAVDVWELGVLGLMIAAVAYKEYDEIPTILTNKAVDMFNSMTSSYGIPPVPKEQYNLDYEFINKVVETGEKVMPTDIIIKKVGDVVKGAAETGAVTGFGYVPPNLTKTDTMETTQKIQPGVQEEKMFEQAKPKKSKATGGAGAKIL